MPNTVQIDTGDPSHSFALAMVCASATPLLLLDGECTVIAASASFCGAFDIDPAQAVGTCLFKLGEGEWDVPQLRTLMSTTASGDAVIDSYETELRRPGQKARCVAVNVRKLAFGPTDEVRLVVSITDVTEARALARRGQDLAHDNDVLLQEVRHRVANSLQIIASVMMLNARRASSEETKGHLRDAHNRVMSVAELQRQLAVTTHDAVQLKPYLEKLCATIAASMIADPKALALIVNAPDVSVEPEVSVSLGLIVTELVINALKHGYPDDAGGVIHVGYEVQDDDQWTLSVADDGVGMPEVRSQAMAGLGTSIVQALARQLSAEVVVDSSDAGTKISIVRCGARPKDVTVDYSKPQPAV